MAKYAVDTSSVKDQLDYAMKHFSFTADQRLKTFHFYVIILAATIAATASATSKSPDAKIFLAIGLAHCFTSLIFFLLDQRSRCLIKTTLEQIKQIEFSEGWPILARIANGDYIHVTPWYSRIASYTGAFRIAFSIQFGLGAIMIGWSFYLFRHG